MDWAKWVMGLDVGVGWFLDLFLVLVNNIGSVWLFSHKDQICNLGKVEGLNWHFSQSSHKDLICHK